MGLAKAGDRIQKPEPDAARSLFVKIAGRRPLREALAQAVRGSRRFLLRVQSECLPRVRQLPHGEMNED